MGSLMNKTDPTQALALLEIGGGKEHSLKFTIHPEQLTTLTSVPLITFIKDSGMVCFI